MLRTHDMITMPLAQRAPWEDPPAPTPAPPVERRMTFSDLQQGLRQYQSGEGDNSLAHGLLIIVASVAVLALVLHLRQRMKTMGPPDSDRKLARELSRAVGFPMFSRLALWWVSRTTGTPMAAMIVCEHLFDVNVAAWAGRPTFSLARGWGKSRLDQLRSKLFAA